MPAAYPLLEALERDADLRQKFFRNLRGLGYGGALLPQESFDRLQGWRVGQLGERLPFGCGWGMTETTSVGPDGLLERRPRACSACRRPARSPLVPAGDRYELRVKGCTSWRATGATRGDAGGVRRRRLLPHRRRGALGRCRQPLAGVAFAGRLSEEFAGLGTWVRATTLRSQLIDALQPHVRDLVIAAPDRPWLGALVWLDATACAEAGGPAVWRPALQRLLAGFNGGRRVRAAAPARASAAAGARRTAIDRGRRGHRQALERPCARTPFRTARPRRAGRSAVIVSGGAG